MSVSLLAMSVVAVAVFFAMPLIQRGLFLEGFLLIVLGVLAAYSVEYMVSRAISGRICPQCGGWTKRVADFRYCRRCGRFYESIRRV
ncbi:MAG: hypothetical protein QW815_08170 [Nitrososphaerota archaeon]